jgi:ABC-type antimicrobial peptide transport system permease subunit
MSRHEIAQTVAIEGLGLAMIGVIGGLVLSVALGHLLIYVVNYQSFGWTLAFRIPWADMLQLAAGVLLIGGLVSYTVGYQSAELPSDREE